MRTSQAVRIPPERYPRALYRCAACHSTFPIGDNGFFPRHVARNSEDFCPSLRADCCVYQPETR